MPLVDELTNQLVIAGDLDLKRAYASWLGLEQLRLERRVDAFELGSGNRMAVRLDTDHAPRLDQILHFSCHQKAVREKNGAYGVEANVLLKVS